MKRKQKTTGRIQTFTKAEVERQLAAEREQCADIYERYSFSGVFAPIEIAKAIRAGAPVLAPAAVKSLRERK